MKSKKVLEIFLFSAILFGIGFLFSNKEVNSVTYITDTQKKIIRDTKRLSDITKLKDAIESYKTINGYYPKLSSGTYIKGYVNSAWSDSWTAFCNTVGLTSNCPSDPINEISNCNCDVFGSTCSSVDLDTDKCYNSKTKQFACTKGSYIYQYQVLNNGKNYSLLMDFEYNQGYGYGNYFNTNSNEGNNIIDVDDNCVSGSNEYKVMSGAAAKCGNKVVESGEFCDGNSKVEFCTNPSGVRGRIAVPCTNSCTYQNVNLNINPECNTKGFCGDSIVQTENGEACDNSSEELCFQTVGQHAWYSEQIRYCKDNCQYNRDATTGINAQTCGGYCGDNIVQSQEECDYNVEYLKWNGISFKQCSSYKTEGDCGNANCLWVNSACVDKKCVNYNLQATCIVDSDCQFVNDSCIPKVATIEKNHCGIRGGSPCKYQNNPAIFSSSFALETRSYLQQNNSFQYSGFIAADTNNKVDVVKNSLFFDIRMKGIKDLDGDSIRYKFDFNDSANDNIGFFENYGYGDLQDVSNRSKEITGQWVQLNQDSEGYVHARIYSTSVESGDINKIKLIDGTYFGDYSFTVSIKDTWGSGANVSGNQQGVINSKSFNFYIGSTCGDFTLQSVNDDGEHEYCEYKSSGAEYFNFSDGEPSITVSGSDTQYCVALKTGTGWSGKWDDEYCGNTSYGICKKTYVPGNCEGNWKSYGLSNNTTVCYMITDVKQTWDSARTYCQNAGGDLFIVRNVTENNWINSLFTTSGNNLYGQSAVWLGYYNINKIREPFDKELNPISVGEYTVDKASMIVSVEENGNSRLNINNIYDGGANELNKYSSQYLCSKSCTDIGGYCGDGILENGLQTVSSYFGLEYKKEPKKYYYYVSNFEQCDPSTNNGKIQTGAGTSISDQYGCVNCMYSAGYCGDTIINYDGDISGNDNQDISGISNQGIDFEHCDPTHKLLPKESGNVNNLRGYGNGGYGANYVCWDSSNIPSTDTNFGTSNTVSPWIPKKTDDTQFSSLEYFIANRNDAKIFEANNNGVCGKSSGGYCGDGTIQVSYNQMPKATRIIRKYVNGIYNTVNTYIKNDSSYGKNSGYFSYGYGYDEENNLTDAMKLEECDPNYFVFPEESNSLNSGYFYKINGGAEISFNGQSRLKYYCYNGSSGTNKCSMPGNAAVSINDSAVSSTTTNIGGDFGYCGDGIVSSYGAKNDFVSYGITNQNTTNREECDPKNHIVGQNGTGYGNGTASDHDKWFGCFPPSTTTGSFIYGRDCSGYITPATSSISNTYACSYGCKDSTDSIYGYCGDGVLQDNFFEECEYSNTSGYNSSYGQFSLYKNFSGTTKNINYLCGKSLNQFGGYFDTEFLYGNNDVSVGSAFSSGIMQNNLLGCKTFGGYLNDGKLQACLINGNGYGYGNWDKCYEKSGVGTIMNSIYSQGSSLPSYNISYGYFQNKAGIIRLEVCDSQDSRGYGWGSSYGYGTGTLDNITFAYSYGYGCQFDGQGCRRGFYLIDGVCKSCPAGSFCPGGVVDKILCPYGKFRNGEGYGSCEVCPVNTSSNNLEGQINCTPCTADNVEGTLPDGSWADSSSVAGYGAKVCTQCNYEWFNKQECIASMWNSDRRANPAKPGQCNKTNLIPSTSETCGQCIGPSGCGSTTVDGSAAGSGLWPCCNTGSYPDTPYNHYLIRSWEDASYCGGLCQNELIEYNESYCNGTRPYKNGCIPSCNWPGDYNHYYIKCTPGDDWQIRAIPNKECSSNALNNMSNVGGAAVSGTYDSNNLYTSIAYQYEAGSCNYCSNANGTITYDYNLGCNGSGDEGWYQTCTSSCDSQYKYTPGTGCGACTCHDGVGWESYRACNCGGGRIYYCTTNCGSSPSCTYLSDDACDNCS